MTLGDKIYAGCRRVVLVGVGVSVLVGTVLGLIVWGLADAF